ncbi:Mobile element protein [Candidatus Enterovibrio altilux]|uniref:Mobile element protein n=1 Tax=Candidatus Enterovibrio altilux TaxID=1927128 RepID=A0A291BBN7_9GAMM|nr:Mobile element protein [Candidatus Enterovibrio luxaltus]
MSCPYYSCISKRVKIINVTFKTRNDATILHLNIYSTRLQVYDEGEWQVKNHGTGGKRRVWHKLHSAVEINTHEIVVAKLSALNMTDSAVLSNLLQQIRLKITEMSGGGPCDTK